MQSTCAFFSLVSLFALARFAHAGFDLSSSSNVAVYWGQNSYNQGSGPLAQQRLGYYCSNAKFNVIQLAFLVTIANPELNFANAGNNCTLFTGTNLFYCPQLEEDIATCQTIYGKTVLLSVGGATYIEGGFSDSTSSVNAANNIWAIFGPQGSNSTVNRPFGSSVIDGFDFDFESSVSSMVPFANQLRSLMDADTAASGKKWFLTAAPQCSYPDSADNTMLDGAVFFDAVWVQFYNNYCGLQSFDAGVSTQNNFNFEMWDNWAKTVSLNSGVKVLLGIPGSLSAAGSGYETGSVLASIISYCEEFSSFGGVMAWDMSQIYANAGFLDEVYSNLASGVTSLASSITKYTMNIALTTTFMSITTIKSTTSSAAAATTPVGPGTVSQWGQCGGTGYTGPAICSPPYTCVEISLWWSQCE